MSRSEDFVGHTSVQEVFDVIWSGETTQKVDRYEKGKSNNDDFCFRSKENILIECLRRMPRHLAMQLLEFSREILILNISRDMFVLSF